MKFISPRSMLSEQGCLVTVACSIFFHCLEPKLGIIRGLKSLAVGRGFVRVLSRFPASPFLQPFIQTEHLRLSSDLVSWHPYLPPPTYTPSNNVYFTGQPEVLHKTPWHIIVLFNSFSISYCPLSKAPRDSHNLHSSHLCFLILSHTRFLSSPRRFLKPSHAILSPFPVPSAHSVLRCLSHTVLI